jgi:hypothetical protein
MAVIGAAGFTGTQEMLIETQDAILDTSRAAHGRQPSLSMICR